MSDDEDASMSVSDGDLSSTDLSDGECGSKDTAGAANNLHPERSNIQNEANAPELGEAPLLSGYSQTYIVRKQDPNRDQGRNRQVPPLYPDTTWYSLVFGASTNFMLQRKCFPLELFNSTTEDIILSTV